MANGARLKVEWAMVLSVSSSAGRYAALGLRAAKPPSVPHPSRRREGLPDNTVRTFLDTRNNSNNRASSDLRRSAALQLREHSPASIYRGLGARPVSWFGR